MKDIIKQAVDRALEEMQLPETPDYVIEKPKDPAHGDLAVNAAFLLARVLRRKPALIAEDIAGRLKFDKDFVDCVEVAPNGFLNFRISPVWSFGQLSAIQREGDKYGRGNELEGHKVVVEFVSSNPTGPLTIGHGRQAALGDVLCSLLAARGADVTREYYYNDAGNQMNILGHSLRARYIQRHDPAFPFPENGYQGEYLLEIAAEFDNEHGPKYLPANAAEAVDEESLRIFREYAAERIRRMIDEDLQNFKLTFDVWSLESDLYRKDQHEGPEDKPKSRIDKLLGLLHDKGLSYEKEGAVWCKTSEYGDDEDRVIVKSTGEPTYFLPDLAYHLNKHERGFDEAINIHGADHHGYVPRMTAGIRMLGYPDHWLRYVIHQMVSFTEGGEQIKMSTRAGKFITLAELCREVGVDVARYFFVMRKADSHLVFDLDLARKHSNENPVYYCQYVHARTCNLTPTAREAGVWDGNRQSWRGHEPSLLKEREEVELAVHLAAYPALVERVAHALSPHLLTEHLEELAGLFHAWYQKHRIVDSAAPELSRDRLYLADCVRRVMANGLELLGITAPEKM
ncbi:MAG: arginine--tRNA ligase [Candidatus Glassbacteria bacterium]|nr:arginine--tRNA ligase [Candidatus Glassbacteria bacterium]